MKRFSIMVRELGSKHEVELCQLDANSNPIAWALEQKREHGVNKYSSVRVVDNSRANEVLQRLERTDPWVAFALGGAAPPKEPMP
jgi:hypothetical protein